MKFIASGPAEASRAIADELKAALAAGKRVLWLVSGGSNVDYEVTIMNSLRSGLPEKLARLVILPMDERYGPPGHKDSNTEALRAAVFDQGKAKWLDVLSRDLQFSETVTYYNQLAAEELAVADVVIGQFGLGTDGHTAGILPGSPAAEEDYATVVGYSWHDYQRMTLSPRALAENVSAGYVLALGENKHAALERLQKNTEPLNALPAKLLYDIEQVYVYIDSDILQGTR